ncbi:MAG TPA: hypothetical protein VF388_02765 [Lacunisphaera sp.]
MKTDCPTVPLSLAAPSAEPRLLRGLYASLERIINTAGFVSVDLTDTVSISLYTARVREAENRANCSE